MPNLYANLDTVKSPCALNISGGSFDARLLALLESASRWIDRHCNRHFYVVQEARVFDGAGPSLLVPDLVQVDSLRTNDGGGGFEEGWEPGQYRLYPNNARPTQPWGRPYHRILAVGVGRKAAFPRGQGTVEVNGCWGFREVWEPAGSVVASGFDLAVDGAALTVDDAGELSPGHTVLLEGEQLFVSGVAGNEMTVQRGINGTAAASHAAGTGLKIFRYPPPVAEACLSMTVRTWLGRVPEAAGPGYSNGRGPETCGPGPEVRELLAGYRRLPTGTGL